MELKDFVKVSLVQIIAGVSEAQKEVVELGVGEISPAVTSDQARSGLNFSPNGMPIHNVIFDVAVGASDKQGTKGAVGIMVSVLKLGIEDDNEQKSTNNSRIQFTIPITLPMMKS